MAAGQADTADKELRLSMLLREKKYEELRAAFADMNEVDVAQFFAILPAEQGVTAFWSLPEEMIPDVFAELPTELQQRVVASSSDRQLSELIEELWIDDAVDMLEEMPAPVVQRIVERASPELQGKLHQYLRYPENSAGSVMTPEFMDLGAGMTVEEALARIRAIGRNKETIYTCYVLGSENRLKGVLSVKDLLLARDGDCVRDIMNPDVISVSAQADREEAAALVVRYDLTSLPVVNDDNVLVGIVTVDDVIDVLREETTEDFQRMAAMSPSERPYLETSIFALARHRLPWLLFLMISGMLTGLVLGRYESVYTAWPLLVTFIPMLTGTGGNAGSQSSTLVIRGLALKELAVGDILRVLWKEGCVSIVVGGCLAAVNYVRLALSYPGSGAIPLVVAFAQFGAVVMANAVGGALPLLARALKIDPAIMAAPLVTTIVDALTLALYFAVAALMLV